MIDEGFRLCTDGTDNHLMLVDLRSFDAELTGKVAQDVCDQASITLNKNQFPYDPRSPFVTSGLRIGTSSVTTQGMTEAEMPLIACAARPGAAPPRRRCGAGGGQGRSRRRSARSSRRTPTLDRR